MGYGFETITGFVEIDVQLCTNCASKVCIEACAQNLLSLNEGHPALQLDPREVKKGKCIECLACELECEFQGNMALKMYFPIPGLD